MKAEEPRQIAFGVLPWRQEDPTSQSLHGPQAESPGHVPEGQKLPRILAGNKARASGTHGCLASLSSYENQESRWRRGPVRGGGWSGGELVTRWGSGDTGKSGFVLQRAGKARLSPGARGGAGSWADRGASVRRSAQLAGAHNPLGADLVQEKGTPESEPGPGDPQGRKPRGARGGRWSLRGGCFPSLSQ